MDAGSSRGEPKSEHARPAPSNASRGGCAAGCSASTPNADALDQPSSAEGPVPARVEAGEDVVPDVHCAMEEAAFDASDEQVQRAPLANAPGIDQPVQQVCNPAPIWVRLAHAVPTIDRTRSREVTRTLRCQQY